MISRQIVLSFLIIFLSSCQEEVNVPSVINPMKTGLSSMELPAEKPDTSLFEYNFIQKEFGRNGGGKLSLHSDHWASLQFWSMIHHRNLQGPWWTQNDTLFIHYIEVHDLTIPEPVDYVTKYVMVRKNLFEILNNKRDSLAYIRQ